MRALKLGIVLLLLLFITAGQWGKPNSGKWGQVETASSGGGFSTPADVADMMFWYDAAPVSYTHLTLPTTPYV